MAKQVAEKLTRDLQTLQDETSRQVEKLRNTLKQWQCTLHTLTSKAKPAFMCLSDDAITTDSMMLKCGHIVCKKCLAEHSNLGHARSAIRCETCAVETPVSKL